MRIFLEALLYRSAAVSKADEQLLAIPRSDHTDQHLQQTCRGLCNNSDVFFKPELGYICGVRLEIEFKQDTRPGLCKPHSVRFAIQEELAQTYDVGIAGDIWTSTSLNDWGTPAVPVRKVSPSWFARLRWLLCNRQPASGGSSTPVATPWKNDAWIQARSQVLSFWEQNTF